MWDYLLFKFLIQTNNYLPFYPSFALSIFRHRTPQLSDVFFFFYFRHTVCRLNLNYLKHCMVQRLSRQIWSPFCILNHYEAIFRWHNAAAKCSIFLVMLQKLVLISLEMVGMNTAGKHLLMPNCKLLKTLLFNYLRWLKQTKKYIRRVV